MPPLGALKKSLEWAGREGLNLLRLRILLSSFNSSALEMIFLVQSEDYYRRAQKKCCFTVSLLDNFIISTR